MRKQAQGQCGIQMAGLSLPQQRQEIFKSFHEATEKCSDPLRRDIREMLLLLHGLLTELCWQVLDLIERYSYGRPGLRKSLRGKNTCVQAGKRYLIDMPLRYDYSNVINLTWHPTENIVSFTTSDGELYMYADFVPHEHVDLLRKGLQPAPFIHDPLEETTGNARKAPTNGLKNAEAGRGQRRGTPDSLDDLLGSDIMGNDGDDFVSDDDGAGYADGVNGNGKRSSEHLDAYDTFDSKRRLTGYGGRPQLHQSFQPGSTPWRGNRRYLCECLNVTALFLGSLTKFRS